MRDVVVSGCGVLAPTGRGVAHLLDAVATGRCALGPARRVADPEMLGAPIGEVDLEVETDGAPRLVQMALDAASEALGDAALTRAELEALDVIVGNASGIRTADDCVLVGVTPLAVPSVVDAQRFTRCASTLQQRLGSHGRAVTLTTACSSGISAVLHGWELVATGRSPLVLCVGVEEFVAGMFFGFQMMAAIAPEPCRPFRGSAGTSFAEGAAAVVIEPRDLALARGARVYGHILGGGQSADAFDLVRPDPDGYGPALAIRRALHVARVERDQVSLIASHGTATAANDAMETTLYDRECPLVPVLATKGIHGHAISASAVIELVIALACLRGHPVSPGCWHPSHPARTGYPARAAFGLKNAFGVGGLNTSLVISDPTRRAARSPSRELGDVYAVRAFAATGTTWLNGVEQATPGVIPVGSMPRLPERFGLSRREWTTTDLLTKQVCAATALVLGSITTEPKSLDNIGLMYATMHGPILSWIIATDAMRNAKPLNPRLIPRMSYSAAPAWTAQKLGLRGPLATYFGGGTGARSALEHAHMLLELEGADAMIVVGADEYTGQSATDRGINDLSHVDIDDPLFAELHGAIDDAHAVPTVTAVLLARGGSASFDSSGSYEGALALDDTLFAPHPAVDEPESGQRQRYAPACTGLAEIIERLRHVERAAGTS